MADDTRVTRDKIEPVDLQGTRTLAPDAQGISNPASTRIPAHVHTCYCTIHTCMQHSGLSKLQSLVLESFTEPTLTTALQTASQTAKDARGYACLSSLCFLSVSNHFLCPAPHLFTSPPPRLPSHPLLPSLPLFLLSQRLEHCCAIRSECWSCVCRRLLCKGTWGARFGIR